MRNSAQRTWILVTSGGAVGVIALILVIAIVALAVSKAPTKQTLGSGEPQKVGIKAEVFFVDWSFFPPNMLPSYGGVRRVVVPGAVKAEPANNVYGGLSGTLGSPDEGAWHDYAKSLGCATASSRQVRDSAFEGARWPMFGYCEYQPVTRTFGRVARSHALMGDHLAPASAFVEDTTAVRDATTNMRASATDVAPWFAVGGILVYGVKPPPGTQGVAPFAPASLSAISRWSQYSVA